MLKLEKVYTRRQCFQLSRNADRLDFLHELYNMCSVVQEDSNLPLTEEWTNIVKTINNTCLKLPTLPTQRKRKREGQDQGSNAKMSKASGAKTKQLLVDSGYEVKAVAVYDFGRDNDCMTPLFQV